MKLLAFGINHKTAPLAIREQALFTPETTPIALQDLLQRKAVNEAIILSTCNRTELYTDATDPQVLAEWLADHHQIGPQILTPYIYSYQDQQAVRHIMRVASGLDSMVLGEPQIMGQLKSAFAMAQQMGAVGSQLERLFQSVFTVSKQVRTDTGVGASPVTIAYAVIKLAKQIFAELESCTALLIGAGDIIELAATHLHSQGIKQILIANRSLEKAKLLAQKFDARGIGIGDVPAYLNQADIVVSATASQLPILGKGAVESALKLRKHRPMLMVDMAVPRDIEAEVATLEDVYLYNLDDLQNIIAENLNSRQEAAKQAEILVELQAAHFVRELRALEANDTICAYREKIESLAEKELLAALEQLQQGKSAGDALSSLKHNLIQKIMHTPSVQLKQAAYDGQLELLLLARRLFEL